MFKMLPPGMSPSEYESSPRGQQGTQAAMEWAKQKGVVLPGMTMPPPPPAQPPKPRAGMVMKPGDQYAIQTLMQMYDVPTGFSPDPEAQVNCPPSRPYCNPVFVDQVGRRWTPGQPNPGAPPHAKVRRQAQVEADRRRMELDRMRMEMEKHERERPQLKVQLDRLRQEREKRRKAMGARVPGPAPQ